MLIGVQGGRRMSNRVDISFAPQGWQCPICKRVYSPWESMCRYCGGEINTVNSPSTTGTPLIDWGRTTSSTAPSGKNETIKENE